MRSPLIEGPDGIPRSSYIFSTSLDSRHFIGSMDPDTVDMQVAIRGAPFSSDPDLIAFDEDSFRVPNPTAYPDGLQLLAGDNELQIRSVYNNGTVSEIATINARLVLDSDIGASLTSPTGIHIERKHNTVEITVEGLKSTGVVGYNIYASTQPGGGVEGYSRVNPKLIISGEDTEIYAPLGELTVDSDVLISEDDTPIADPLYFSYLGTQENRDETTLGVNFEQVIEIPENVRKVRSTLSLESAQRVTYYSFRHDRQATFNSLPYPAIPNSAFNAIPRTDPLYYVATAIYDFDGREYESAFSPEVAGYPLDLTPSVGSFPTVSRQAIVRDTIGSIYRTQPLLDVKPGSVVRDTFIDPMSTEVERARFILDFLHRSSSFATLLPIDDPTSSGESIPVEQSDYKIALKQAFFLNSTAAVQQLIDGIFDALAARYGKTRHTGLRARGPITVFTPTRPTTSIELGIGTRVIIGGNPYRLTSSISITSSGAGAFFSPSTGRYSATAYIQAEETGRQGNLTAGQRGVIEGGPVGVEAMSGSLIGGQDEESNHDLATRALNALSSVDSGTFQGYVDRATQVAGVEQVSVVDAGHPLMLRDLHDGRHIGGKVDIWLKGKNTSKVSDSFAFSFSQKLDVQFEPVGDPQQLRLRAIDPSLSADNPIIEMLDYPEFNIALRNETTGLAFELTGVSVIAHNIIQLDTSLNDPSGLSLHHVVKGSYRYRTSNKHTFSRQPVSRIVHMTGEESGILPPAIYGLFKPSDPLLKGQSLEAGDYVQVTTPLNGTPIPSGRPLSVVGERHIILNGIEYLNRLGANPYSLVVTDSSGAATYRGPFEESPDYTIIPGDSTTPMGIRATTNSRIKEGDTLIMSYSHDENFTVEYEINALVGTVSSAIERYRHITADVLTKEAIETKVDITVTVVLSRQASATATGGLIRTALKRYFESLTLGSPVRQADIVSVIKRVNGVSYPIVPLTRLAKADSSIVVREPVVSAQASDMVGLWETQGNRVWLLKSPLSSSTVHGGGVGSNYRGVFEDNRELESLTSPPDITGSPLKLSDGKAFVVGQDGLLIPGYSDNETLQAMFPFATDSEIAQKRVEITANRLLVTLLKEDSPLNHEYTVTYQVWGDTGVSNIEPSPVEYLSLGVVDLTFDEDLKR